MEVWLQLPEINIRDLRQFTYLNKKQKQQIAVKTQKKYHRKIKNKIKIMSALSTSVPPPSDSISSHESAFVQQSSSSSAMSLSPVPATATTTANTNPSTMSSIQPSGLLSFDHYRFQLYNYAMAERLRCAQYSQPVPQICSNYPAAAAAALMGPYGPRLALSMSLFHNRVFQPEEPKPQHSYIGLIAIAILSSPESKLVLSDIYQYILDNYPYFRSRGPGWRNSIRHNLSLNDCFVKAGRSANGKGHYWAIHPANQEDFKKGDFRRRKAQRKVRKHMGLSVDDDGTDSPSPPPLSITPPPISTALQWMNAIGSHPGMFQPTIAANTCRITTERTEIQTIYNKCDNRVISGLNQHQSNHHQSHHIAASTTKMFSVSSRTSSARKRQFDVASLLAPDNHDLDEPKLNRIKSTHCDIDEDIDVEESEESDNNNRSSIFDAENYHRQQKMRIVDNDIEVRSKLKNDSSDRRSNDTTITDSTDVQDSNHDDQTNHKKITQYSNVCELDDDAVARLPYHPSNDDNHLDVVPTIRQHLDINNVTPIDPRILNRYYGQRIVNHHHNAH